MRFKYDIGDIIFCNTDITTPFYMLIQDKIPFDKEYRDGATWGVDVYCFLVLEDGETGYINAAVIDDNYRYSKVA